MSVGPEAPRSFCSVKPQLAHWPSVGFTSLGTSIFRPSGGPFLAHSYHFAFLKKKIKTYFTHLVVSQEDVGMSCSTNWAWSSWIWCSLTSQNTQAPGHTPVSSPLSTD